MTLSVHSFSAIPRSKISLLIDLLLLNEFWRRFSWSQSSAVEFHFQKKLLFFVDAGILGLGLALQDGTTSCVVVSASVLPKSKSIPSKFSKSLLLMTIWCWVHGWRKNGIPCKLGVTSFGIPFFTSFNCYLTVPRLCVVLDFPLRLQKVSLITNLRPRHFLFWFGRALLWTLLICFWCRSPQPPEAAVHPLKKYTIQLYFWVK